MSRQQKAFPADFRWGAASSSFQIEGRLPDDGCGSSIWDDFCAKPGTISDGSDGRIACAHLEHWQKDIDLLAEMGANAYRFSISWPRILPEGRGRINDKGLDFYKKLIDGLLARGIEPWATLYHWDLPSTLDQTGGWLNRDTAEAFADYTSTLVERLKDRVQHWITHNEPRCVAFLGYQTGEHAPGHKNPREALVAAHHVLLSHGLAMARIRSLAPNARAGITVNLDPTYPANPESEADHQAARLFDGFVNRWYLDPVFYGHYPADVMRHHESQGTLGTQGWDFIHPGDDRILTAKTDFLGVNYYSRAVVGPRAPVDRSIPESYTAMGWEVYPRGLYDLFVRLAQDYPAPAYYITENGAAYADVVSSDGQVHDPHRTAYFRGHLEQAAEICRRGIPLKGYFAWSVMDNFEWAHGYSKRFGLIYVDYATQKRIPKDSFRWYQKFIREQKG